MSVKRLLERFVNLLPLLRSYPRSEEFCLPANLRSVGAHPETFDATVRRSLAKEIHSSRYVLPSRELAAQLLKRGLLLPA
jgi:hypothetical protein